MLDTVTAPLVDISQALSAATEGGEPSFHTAAFERRLSPLARLLRLCESPVFCHIPTHLPVALRVQC